MSLQLVQELFEHGGHIPGIERAVLFVVAWRAFDENDPQHADGGLRKAGNQLLAPRQAFIVETEFMHAIGLAKPAILDEPGAAELMPQRYAQAAKQWDRDRRNKRNALSRLKDRYGLDVRVKHHSGLTAVKGHVTVYQFPTVEELRASEDRFEEWLQRRKPVTAIEKQRRKRITAKAETSYHP